MGLLGWGLFGALFGIADEINIRKDIKQEQAASAKRVAEFKQRTDACKALAFNTCIKMTQTSPRQIHLSWDCQDSDNSVAKEFKVYRNYQQLPLPKEVTTLPFIRGKTTYEYADTFLPSENPCTSYTVTLCSMYEGRVYTSSVRAELPIDIKLSSSMMSVKLKKIDLHVEFRDNGSAKLFWNRQDNVTTYKVYRSKSENEEDFIPIVLLEGAARRYTDHNVNWGQTYTYFVQAVYTA